MFNINVVRERGIASLPLLFGTLIAGLIISLLNLIFKNSMIDIIIDWIILFIFFGITAYDMNKIKQLTLIDSIDKSASSSFSVLYIYPKYKCVPLPSFPI